MTSRLSVLRKAKPSDVRLKPFPYLAITNCLDIDLYSELSRTYPSDRLIAELNRERIPEGLAGNNIRTDISAAKALANRLEIANVWLDFIEYHVSNDFYREVLHVFEEPINLYYPWLSQLIGPLDQARSGVRFDPRNDKYPISLDCQIGINTPSNAKSSVIEAHTDSPEELFAGLLYFKQNTDQAGGGDLELYRWKHPRRFCRGFTGHLADKDLINKVGKLKCEANTLVFFLNTIDSVHGVTPRDPSTVSRRLVNIIGEVYNAVPGLYDKPARPMRRLWQSAKPFRSALRKIRSGNWM